MYHPRYPDREETSFRRACIKRHSGSWPPPKNRVDCAGRQRRTSASSTHSCGLAPLLYKDYVYRRLKTTVVSLLGRLWQSLPQDDKGKEDLGTIKGGETTP
jgi:hypothetical protein